MYRATRQYTKDLSEPIPGNPGNINELRQNDGTNLRDSQIWWRCCQIFMISQVPPSTVVNRQKTGMWINYSHISLDRNEVKITSLIVIDRVKLQTDHVEYHICRPRPECCETTVVHRKIETYLTIVEPH